MSRLSRTALSGTLLCLAPLATPAHAQDDHPVRFTVDASGRVRFDAIAGQPRVNAPEHDQFVSFRTLVAAKVELGPVVLGGEINDSRGYAEASNSSVRTSEVNALEPIQAYAALHTGGLLAKGDTATLTGGRFSMDIGSSRLVGRTDFPDGVQSYLGVMGEWRSHRKDRLVAFWTRPFSALPDDVDAIHDNRVVLDRAGGNLTFFGASAALSHVIGSVDAEAYGYRLAEQDRTTRPTRNRHLVTVGGRVRRAPAKRVFDFEVEAAYQGGRARLTAGAADRRDLDVRAGFAHAEAGWTFPSGWSPRLSAMADYVSGDGKAPGVYGRFDTLFGARRGDFGPLSLYGEVARANLVSPGLRFEAKPSKRFDFMVAGRDLWLADATDSFGATGVRDKTGASGRHVGTQVEWRARRWLVPARLKLEVGGAWLAKGRFLTRAPNAPRTGDTRYGYADLSVSF